VSDSADGATSSRARLPAATPWAVLLLGEAAVLGAHVALAGAGVEPRYLLYPFVWVNAGLWAVWRVGPVRAAGRRRRLAAGVGLAYLLVLVAVDGTLGLASGAASGLRVAWLPPGWGPAVLYRGTLLDLTLFPFKAVGYAALSYLVAATVASATRTALGGLVGLFSCTSCTLPVAAAVVSGVAGGTGVLAAGSSLAWSYDLSTAVFVLSVGLLVAGYERTGTDAGG
jgi:hypothetical protein